MAVLDRGPSIGLFFKLFELSRTHENGSEPRRHEQVSFKKKPEAPKLFKAYCDSAKPWRQAYVWVVPIGDTACRFVASLDEAGDVLGTKFPLGWTYSHYEHLPAVYRTTTRLDEYDEESLRALMTMASWLPNRQFECKHLVRAKNLDEFKSILGAVYLSGHWERQGEMSQGGFKALLQQSKKGRKPASPPLTPLNPPQGGPTIQADVAPGRGGSSVRDRRRDGEKRKERPVDVVTVDVAEAHPKKQLRKPLPPLDLENLTDSDVERFKRNPILFMAELAKAADRKLSRFKEEEEVRRQGIKLVHQNLWLEIDLEDKTDKFHACLGVLSELREELESTKKRLGEVECSAVNLEKERDEAVAARGVVETKLKVVTAKLSGQVEMLNKRLVEVEGQRDRAVNDHEDLKDQVVGYCEERFEEALRQVKCMQPEIEFDRGVIQYSHFAEDGRIVRPAQVDEEGRVISQETVVWPLLA